MSRKKKMAIVPSLVLTASFATVIPAAVASCSGNDPVLGNKDAKPDTIWYGVAAVAYCCFEAGVAEMGFDADAKVSEAEAGEAGDARDGG